MRMLHVLAVAGVIWAPGASSTQIRDLDGRWLTPLKPAGKAEVLFFLATDCPVSNSFAPEIQRICRDYEPKGVGCTLVYEDVGIDAPGVRRHLAEYRYEHVAAAIDGDRRLAGKTHATVTPEAVVIDHAGTIRYRGRVNNFYAALGKPRQVVTEHDVRDALDAVLTGKRVRHHETQALGCFIVPPDILRKGP